MFAAVAFASLVACSTQPPSVTPSTVAELRLRPLNAEPSAALHVLYVQNYASWSVTEYPFDAGGDAKPLREIVGQKTLIRQTTSLAVDAGGHIYVSNRCYRTFPAAILVFSPLANGDVAPVRILHRPLHTCERGIWVDSSGYLYLAEYNVHDVAVFAPGANGFPRRVRRIAGSNTGLLCPFGVATDTADNLFVADHCARAILEFSPTADGNVAPVARISGSKTQLHRPYDVKIGSGGKIYVYDSSSGTILVFPAEANGNVAPIAVLPPPSGEYFIGDIATFGSDLITGVGGIPTNVWGVNTYSGGSKITLLRTITGPDTALDGPAAEAVH